MHFEVWCLMFSREVKALSNKDEKKKKDKGHGASWNQAHGRRDKEPGTTSQQDRERDRNIGHPNAEEHNRDTTRGGSQNTKK